ncbi:MAG: Flp family type IVb pilin [Pseudomonadota bacterium]
MKALFKEFLNDEDGATAIEYGLIAALVGIAIITGITQLGDQLNETFVEIEGALDAADDGLAPAAP